MSRWRKVLDQERNSTTWALRLECGHEAYRSDSYGLEELPSQVLCQACDSLIGSHVRNHLGKVGTISGYSGGQFAVSWGESDKTRCTLDELREEIEFV